MPYGCLTPRRHYVLLFYNQAKITYEPQFRVIRLTPYAESDNFVLVESRVRRAIWKNQRQYLALTCPEEDNLDSCRVVEGAIIGVSGAIYTGHTFNYAPVGDSLAVVQDDYTLIIRTSTPRAQHQHQHNLDDWLDAPIAAVEWLPSLLYKD